MDLVIVDISYYIYRAHYASLSAGLTTPSGFPTGILKFLTTMMHDVRREFSCPIVLAFDGGGKNHRHELYPEYKANRKERPDEITKQMPILINIMRAMGFALIKKKGVEADDLIGTLSIKADALGMKTIILTGDKDMGQFITKNVTLFDSKSNKYTDRKALKENIGIKPSQVAQYLALCGDASDNIPGVDGIGPKTASTLLSEYGSLKGIYQHLADLPKGQRKKLEEQKDVLKLSLKLTKHKDIPIALDPSELRLPSMDKVALRRIFREFNLNFMWAK